MFYAKSRLTVTLTVLDKGAAKVAKKLGFDYAEAVTGFEFKKGKAFPILEGIVITEENEETMLEVFQRYKKHTIC